MGTATSLASQTSLNSQTDPDGSVLPACILVSSDLTRSSKHNDWFPASLENYMAIWLQKPVPLHCCDTSTHPRPPSYDACLDTVKMSLPSLTKAGIPEIEDNRSLERYPAFPAPAHTRHLKLARVRSTHMQNHRARSGQIHFIQSWHQTGESCCGCQRPRGGNPLSSANETSSPKTTDSDISSLT